ncbi:MAG TPA: hypothetical protein VME18_10960 [Acidobacteriaceae bacterium]|nr:hypothetical protein [Acidobacteriaceae bacterium]
MRHVRGFVSATGFLAFALTGLLAVPAGAQSAVTAQTLMSKLKWRCVGPFIGGRVVTVDGVAGKNIYYAGAVGGGVWKSTDYGLVWQNITDGKLGGTSSSIGAIAVAPSSPNVLYAGTGEDDIRNDMIPGDGMYKSTDGGKTWVAAGLEETHSIAKIVVDPKDANVVYAASMGHVFVPGPNRGVFKSTDGGKTWNRILFVDNRTGAIDLVMDPNHQQVLYATMWQAQRMPWGLKDGGPGSGLYKTTDGGVHWTNLTHNPGFATGTLGRIGVSLVAEHPNTVYTLVQAKDGGVFRSDDGGATWKMVNNEMKLRQRAFYYMAIYADPKDVNTVYAPQVDALWVSRDGGKTWTKLHTPHGDNHVVWIDPTRTNVLLEGNDGGVTVSTDGGKTWSTDHNQPTGQFYHVNLDNQFPFHIYGAQQDEGAFEGPSASPHGAIPLADWQTVAYGESTFVVPEPGRPNMTYGSGYYSIFVKYNLHTGQYESVSPWPLYRDGAASNELRYRFGWTHPIQFSPDDPKELLIAAQNVLRSDDYGETWTQISPDLTRNNPQTELPSGGPIDLDASGAEVYPEVNALAVSPLDGNLIWAGSDDGLVHVTTDGGRNWTLVTPAGLPDCAISSIEPSHVDRNTAYMTAWRYMWDDFRPMVYETTDLGQTWTKITTGLPDDEFAFVVRQDPKDPKLLFLGTFSTVYVSLDGGARWQPLKLNLPTAEVRDIAINSRQGDVAIATHGRAFWVLDNLALLEQLTKAPELGVNSAQVFAPEQAWLTQAYGGGPPRPGRAAGTNPPFGATVFFHIPQNYDGKTPVSLTFLDAQGNVVRKFELHQETAKEKQEKTEEKAGKKMPDHSGDPLEVQMRRALEKLTEINPGMNSFQWDLRYAPVTQIPGYHAPEPEGDRDELVDSPTVVPGTYQVVLDFGGQKTQTSFTVAPDPRLKATQQDLEAELTLCQQIEADLDGLDKEIDQAMALRDKLEKAGGSAAAVEGLDRAIADTVQMNNHASEEDLMHEVRTRGLLAFLASDVEWAYAHPTAAQYQVFQYLDAQTKSGKQELEAAIAAAK